MEKGFVKFNRRFGNGPLSSNPNTMAVLLRCLLNANIEESIYEGHSIPAGSFVTSIAILSQQTGVKENSVRSSLKHLQTSNIISIQSTNRYTIITINDTDIYAGSVKTEINSTHKQNSIQPTTEKELRIIEKEDKKKEDTLVSSKKEKPQFVIWLTELGIDEKVAEDWFAIRKSQKAKETETALKMIGTALDKVKSTYGITATEAISICVAKGWYGCNASYFENIRFSDYGITPAHAQQEINLQLKKDYWQ